MDATFILKGMPDTLTAAVEELARYQGITPLEFIRRSTAAEVQRLRPETRIPHSALWDPESAMTRLANSILVTTITGGFSEVRLTRRSEGFMASYVGKGKNESPTPLPLHIAPLLRNRYLEMAHQDPRTTSAPVEGVFSIVSGDHHYRVGLRWHLTAGEPLGETLTLWLTLSG